jgi:hypothetical protein
LRTAAAATLRRIAVLIINPLRAVSWLFTNVRFATVFAGAAGDHHLLGVVIPQVPFSVRGDSVAEAAWLDSKEATFGVLIEPMDALGLFDIFHTVGLRCSWRRP